MRPHRWVLWLLRAVLPLAFVVAVAQILVPFSTIPQVDMNASRVVPSVAIVKGYDIYAGPTDGPVIDFMYGPVGALVFLPAALATTPSGALLIAAVLNVLLFFAPITWLHLRGCERRWSIGLAGLLLFALLAALDGGLSYSAFTVHIDAPALALCATAAALLLSRTPGAGNRRVILSAACSALAIWTKQTTVPIALALPLFLLVTDGLRPALRHGIWTVAFGVALAILFVAWFGFEPMVFNMFTLLQHHPWYGEAEGHGRLPAALNSLRLLAIANRGPALLVALTAVLVAREERPDWTRERPWILLLTIGMLMVPMCVLGGAKVGGYLNTHSYTTYFVLGAATLGLTRLASRRPDGLAALALLALLVVLIVRFAAAPLDIVLVRQAWARAAAWSDNPQEHAYAYARAHPGDAYFPWNPLSTLLADGVLFHSEIGMWNRELAGIEPTPAHLRQHLPADVRVVASRPATGNLTWLPPANHHMPGFTHPTSVPGLEGWQVFTRE